MRIGHALCLLFSCCLLSEAATAGNTTHDGKISLDQSKDVLFEQLASNTYALQLLQAKNKFDNKTLVLGGLGWVDLQHWQGDDLTTLPPEKYHIGSGLYLTEATIDALVNYTNWMAGFLSVSDNQIGQGGPDGNYVYLPHALLLFGDLNKYPFYLATGVNSISFGNFIGSGVWNVPLTSGYFAPQPGPQINLGLYKNNWDISTTLYGDNVNHENHFVVNLNYNNTLGDITYGFGLGHISDLKTNSTGNPTTKGHKKHSPAIDMGKIFDVNATVGYKLLSLIGEYLAGSKSVGINSDVPKAFNFTLSFTPTLFGKVTTFGVSRSVTLNFKDIPASLPGKDAVPVVASGLKNSTAVSVSRPIFAQNIILGFDAEKAITYEKKHTFTYTLDLLAYL